MARWCFPLPDPKTLAKTEEKRKADLAVQNIASLFRGEII